MLVPKAIVGKILRGEATLAYRPASTRRPRPGERLYVKARQRDEVACHVIALGTEDVRLGDVTFEQARACGHKTTADFKADWVARFDADWVKRHGEAVDEASGAYAVDDEEILARFERRWAPQHVHLVTFVLDTSEQPIMLMQGSPLTDGGKARLMSNRKLPPGRAKSPTMHKDSPEARGYTQSGPRAMPREAEPVDIATVERFAKEGHQGWAARELQRQADREQMGWEERYRRAEAEALAAGVDPEVYRASIEKRLRALERATRTRRAV